MAHDQGDAAPKLFANLLILLALFAIMTIALAGIPGSVWTIVTLALPTFGFSQRDGKAAIDRQHMAVDVGRGTGGKENHRASQFLRLRPSSGGRSRFNPCGKFLVIQKRGIEFGGKIAGSERIDGNAMAA